jgi:hypothetical protein
MGNTKSQAVEKLKIERADQQKYIIIKEQYKQQAEQYRLKKQKQNDYDNVKTIENNHDSISTLYSKILKRDLTSEENLHIKNTLNSYYDKQKIINKYTLNMYGSFRDIDEIDIIYDLHDQLSIVYSLNTCTKIGLNIWEKNNKPPSIYKYITLHSESSEKLTNDNINRIMDRYLQLALYIETSTSTTSTAPVIMTEYKMKMLLHYMVDIDTHIDISLYTIVDTINSITLIELFAQSFLKLDLRLPIQKRLDKPSSINITNDINDINDTDPPPKYTEEGAIQTPLKEPSAPPLDNDTQNNLRLFN